MEILYNPLVPERQSFQDQIYFAKIRLQYDIKRVMDNTRYKVAHSEEKREAFMQDSETFLADFTSFLDDSLQDQVDRLQLLPTQELSLRQLLQSYRSGELLYYPTKPNYKAMNGSLAMESSTASADSSFRTFLHTSYHIEGSTPRVHSGIVTHWVQDKFIPPILYYAFSKKPESQEELRELLQRDDCVMYGKGERIDVAGANLGRPAIYREFGTFSATDGNQYTVYGWGEGIKKKEVDAREKTPLPERALIFSPNSI